MPDPFLKLMNNNYTLDLIKKPNLLALLTLIAIRAKRTNEVSVNDLEIGEAFIGDYKNCGLTEQKYRTAKETLENRGFVTFKSTNRGTVAKLLDKRIFDINPELGNEQITNKQRTDNEQITTNKKVRKKEILITSNEVIETASAVDRRNPEINKMLDALKGKIRIQSFADSAIERNIGKHCVNLMKNIGKDEFVRRLDIILSDPFKHKNCNRIKFVYNEIKGFIEPISTSSMVSA